MAASPWTHTASDNETIEVANDRVSSVDYQLVKVGHGDANTATRATATTPLPASAPVVKVTATVAGVSDSSNYSSGDVIGTPTELAGIVGAAGGTGKLLGLTLCDAGADLADDVLAFVYRATPSSPPADNDGLSAIPDPSKLLAILTVDMTPSALAGGFGTAAAGLIGGGIPIDCTATSLFVLLAVPSTAGFDFDTTTSLSVTVHVERS